MKLQSKCKSLFFPPSFRHSLCIFMNAWVTGAVSDCSLFLGIDGQHPNSGRPDSGRAEGWDRLFEGLTAQQVTKLFSLMAHETVQVSVRCASLLTPVNWVCAVTFTIFLSSNYSWYWYNIITPKQFKGLRLSIFTLSRSFKDFNYIEKKIL